MSQLSLSNAYAHQHQGHSSSFGAQTSGSTTSAGPSNRSDMAEASATSTSTTPASTYIAPERRRRRSSRGVGGPSKAPSRKASSAKSIAETKANPDEPLIPTRHYQFKSFESFDATASSSSLSLPAYTSSSTPSLPQGGGYTFGPPPTFAAEAGQGGEALDGHAGTSSSPGTAQQPPKKSKAIFSVGKKVVKEVLGGGGNNTTALPPEAKAVYYGRGGAGGAGARAAKPQPSTSTLANGVHPTPHPPSSGRAASASQRCESRQTGSYYTGSSSNYTPSILSSPYAESIASSPNATSVEDGQSVYAPSSYSAPLTMSSLGRPSPSHRSVSPSVSALSEDNWRRDSIVSTTTSYAESSYGSEAADSWQSQAEQQTVWQNPFAGETIQEVERIETPVSMEDSLSPPGGASEGSVTYDGAPAQQVEQPARQVLVPSTHYQQQQVLRHRPSQPSLLSSFPRHTRTQSGHITPSYSSNASATSSASSTPYQPSNATNLLAGGGETNLGGLYPMSAAQAQGGGELNGDVVQNGATSAGRLQQVYPTYANGGTSVVQQPQQPSRAPAVPQDSLRPPTSPGGGRVSRPLPDPLATAVGQLSLIQNPLSLGWPTPQHQQAQHQHQHQHQQQPKQPPLSMLDPTLVSALYGAANGSQYLSNQGTHLPTQQQQSQPLFQSGTGLLTPNYTIQPQPQQHQQQPPPQQQQPQQLASAAALGIAGAQDYTQSLVYQQALAEQQALARRLAQLERLQQEAARMAAQDPYTNLNSGRGVL